MKYEKPHLPVTLLCCACGNAQKNSSNVYNFPERIWNT